MCLSRTQLSPEQQRRYKIVCRLIESRPHRQYIIIVFASNKCQFVFDILRGCNEHVCRCEESITTYNDKRNDKNCDDFVIKFATAMICCHEQGLGCKLFGTYAPHDNNTECPGPLNTT